MRLLVTRPMEDGLALADNLAAAGHDVLLAPLIEINAKADALPAAAEIDALALTSANGVRALYARCRTEDASNDAPESANLSAWQNKPAYAVGPQTAAALRHYGWQNPSEAEGDVVALAKLLAQDLPAGRTVLHIAGQHRAGNLAKALAEAGLNARRAVLYEAVAATQFSDATRIALSDAEEPIDGVLLYSARTADIFCRLMAALPPSEKQAAAAMTAYCLSENVAALASAAGFATRIAEKPHEAALLSLLNR